MKTFAKILTAFLAPWTSRKLWMSVIGLMVINALYWTSVFYLYSFSEQWRAELFYKMFASTAWVTSMVVLGYLGLQTLAQGWTNQTVNTASSVIESAFSKHESKSEVKIDITEHVDPNVVRRFADQYSDDPSYSPLAMESIS